MNAPGHFDFYTFVLFLHIASAVVAFGATFAYPLIEMTLQRVDLRALPAWHEAQNQVGHKLITPGAILILITGVYLVTTDRWDGFGGFWFGAAGAIVDRAARPRPRLLRAQRAQAARPGARGPRRRRRRDAAA